MIIGMLLLLIMMAFPMALLIDCALDRINDLTAFRQFSLRQLLVGVTCLALYLSLLVEPWTFHMAFALSRGALERVAASVEAGDQIEPQWAGLFFIERVERKQRGDKVFTVLWADPEAGFVHPGSVSFPHNDYSIALRHDPDWSFFIQD